MWTTALLLFSSAFAADARDDLLARYDDLSKADHRFVIEADAAAARPDDVRAMLVAAAGALPAGDRIEVLIAGPTVDVLVPTTLITEDGRAAMAATLSAREWPAVEHVDLGAAFGQLVTDLTDEPVDQTQFIYTLGDLCNDPPEGSAWAFDSAAGCRQIRGVSKLTDALAPRAKAGRLRPLALINGRVDEDGQRALFKMMGKSRPDRADTINIDRTDLGSWMTQRGERIPYEKLAVRVANEITALDTTVLSVEADGDQAKVKIGSGLEKLSFVLDHLRVRGNGLSPVEKKLRLAPDATLNLRLDLPEPPLALWPHERPLRFTGTLSATATLEPRAALGRLGVQAGRGLIELPIAVDTVQRYGLPWWASATGLLALAGLAVLIGRRRVRESAESPRPPAAAR